MFKLGSGPGQWLCFVSLCLAGCALESGVDPVASEPDLGKVGGAQRELKLGSRGEDVEHLHKSLRAYGYFPNPELAHDYPAWRPIVAQAPEDEREFGQNTQLAVRAYQRNTGLLTTGVVDAETWDALHARVCGTPDGIAALDQDAKFNPGTGVWNKRSFTYSVRNADTFDLDYGTTLLIISQAFQAWANQTNLTFTPFDATATADFELKFAAIDGFATGYRAKTSGTVVTFDDTERWVNTGGIPSDGSSELYQFALHEIGHLLGIPHSSNPDLMRNDCGGRRSLSSDDKLTISLKYDNFSKLESTTAVDVATAQNTGNIIWFATSSGSVRTNASGSWVSSTVASGKRAQRIIVDRNNVPWVTDQNGEIYCRPGVTSGNWVKMPGCARDLATNKFGDLWGLDCGSFNRPQRWIASLTCSTSSAGSAPWQSVSTPVPNSERSISLALTQSGFPIVVTSSNKILRRGSFTSSGTTPWLEVPVVGPNPGRAIDVAVDGDDLLWVIGMDNRFYLYVEQPCQHDNLVQCASGQIDPMDNGAFAVRNWFPMTEGLGFRIAAPPGGLVVTGMDNQIYGARTLR